MLFYFHCQRCRNSSMTWTTWWKSKRRSCVDATGTRTLPCSGSGRTKTSSREMSMSPWCLWWVCVNNDETHVTKDCNKRFYWEITWKMYLMLNLLMFLRSILEILALLSIWRTTSLSMTCGRLSSRGRMTGKRSWLRSGCLRIGLSCWLHCVHNY